MVSCGIVNFELKIIKMDLQLHTRLKSFEWKCWRNKCNKFCCKCKRIPSFDKIKKHIWIYLSCILNIMWKKAYSYHWRQFEGMTGCEPISNHHLSNIRWKGIIQALSNKNVDNFWRIQMPKRICSTSHVSSYFLIFLI